MAKYCSHCGNLLNEKDKFCAKCGYEVDGEDSSSHDDEAQVLEKNDEQVKSKIAAGLLGILLGGLGVHNFYLGYTSKAVCQLLLTLVGWILCGIGPVVASVWGLVEGILILTSSSYFDANGNRLQD